MKLLGALPSTSRTASPAFNPALPAGLCGCTLVITSGEVPDLHPRAKPVRLHKLGREDVRQRFQHAPDGDGKADALRRLPLAISLTTATLMPINSPRRFTSGPPLLPKLMGASVCSQFGMSSGSPSLGSDPALGAQDAAA